MEFKRWSACVTYATNIGSEHARCSRLTKYVRLSLLPQAGEGLTVYARCSDQSKKRYLLVSNVCEHRDSSAKFRTVRLQLTFLSHWLLSRKTHNTLKSTITVTMSMV